MCPNVIGCFLTFIRLTYWNLPSYTLCSNSPMVSPFQPRLLTLPYISHIHLSAQWPFSTADLLTFKKLPLLYMMGIIFLFYY